MDPRYPPVGMTREGAGSPLTTEGMTQERDVFSLKNMWQSQKTSGALSYHSISANVLIRC